MDLELSGLLKCVHICCKNRALFSQVLRLERCAITCILQSGLLRARKWLANCAKKGPIHVSHAEVEISESQPLSTTCQSLFPVSIIPPWAPLNGKVLIGHSKGVSQSTILDRLRGLNLCSKYPSFCSLFECLQANRKIALFQALFFDPYMVSYRHHPDVCTLRCAYSNRGCLRRGPRPHHPPTPRYAASPPGNSVTLCLWRLRAVLQCRCCRPLLMIH